MGLALMALVTKGSNAQVTNQVGRPAQVNSADIEKLREKANKPNKGVGSSNTAAQIQLARLGDREQMQSIVCELWYSKDVRLQSEAVDKLGRVGGYASIQALAKVMLDDPDKDSRPREGYLVARREFAIKELSNLIPELNVRPLVKFIPYMATEQEVRQMYNWIQEHRDQVYSPPTEVVEVDKKTCKNIRKQQAAAWAQAQREAKVKSVEK